MRVRLFVVATALVAGLLAAIPAQAQLDPQCPAFTATRLRLRKLDWPLGGQRVLFRGTTQVAEDAAFDPSESGMRFVMTDDAGTVMADVTVPGQGWAGSRLGGTWSYVDREGQTNGLRRVLIRRSRTSLRVYIYGQDMTFGKPVRHVYVHVYIPSDDGGVVCGSRYFHELGCAYRNSGGKLNCY